MVKLAWCLHAGSPRPVSAFADLPAPDRPLVTCPDCHEPVTLKLGARMAHHAAHRKDSECPSARESALHTNVKFFLWSRLNAAHMNAKLQFVGPCSACRRPWHRAQPLSWTSARLEHTIGSVRPDIVLFLKDSPVFAIEVVATHAMSPDAVARATIPWAEIGAVAELYSSPPGFDLAWTVTAPLPIRRSSESELNLCYLCR